MNAAQSYQEKLNRAMTDHQTIDGNETEHQILLKSVSDAKSISESEIKTAEDTLSKVKEGTDEQIILEAETALDEIKNKHKQLILDAETKLNEYCIANKIPKVIK